MQRTMREEVADFKRASILKEAVRQFFSKGYDGTRIDEIAASLGMTKPFIYYHFKNKTEILDEICVQSRPSRWTRSNGPLRTATASSIRCARPSSSSCCRCWPTRP